MAACDGGVTPERQRKVVCWELGVPYWPPRYDVVDLEEGYAIYHALSWLSRTGDGPSTPPYELPARQADGSIAASDERSLALADLIADTQRGARSPAGTGCWTGCGSRCLAWRWSSPTAATPAAWSTGPDGCCGSCSRSCASPEGRVGFAVLPRRWVIDCWLSWLVRFRRPVRDYEWLPHSMRPWSSGP